MIMKFSFFTSQGGSKETPHKIQEKNWKTSHDEMYGTDRSVGWLVGV